MPRNRDLAVELSDWLISRRTGITDVVELEGFLTALVIGPNTLSPTLWLPKVWGGRTPKFKDIAEMNRFVALVVGPYNDIALTFDQAPQTFRPTFYENKLEGARGGGEKRMHRRWSVKVAPAVKAIHAYWIPHRIVQHREALGEKTH
jgi:yecA family protein